MSGATFNWLNVSFWGHNHAQMRDMDNYSESSSMRGVGTAAVGGAVAVFREDISIKFSAHNHLRLS